MTNNASLRSLLQEFINTALLVATDSQAMGLILDSIIVAHIVPHPFFPRLWLHRVVKTYTEALYCACRRLSHLIQAYQGNADRATQLILGREQTTHMSVIVP